jgi:hypothetical protein
VAVLVRREWPAELRHEASRILTWPLKQPITSKALCACLYGCSSHHTATSFLSLPTHPPQRKLECLIDFTCMVIDVGAAVIAFVTISLQSAKVLHTMSLLVSATDPGAYGCLRRLFGVPRGPWSWPRHGTPSFKIHLRLRVAVRYRSRTCQRRDCTMSSNVVSTALPHSNGNADRPRRCPLAPTTE